MGAHHINQLASDIATAHQLELTGGTARFVSVKHTDVLVHCAKRLQRLQTRRLKLRKELRQVETDIKRERKDLKALAQQIGRGE